MNLHSLDDLHTFRTLRRARKDCGEQGRLWPTPPTLDTHCSSHSPPSGPQEQFLSNCSWPHQQGPGPPTATNSHWACELVLSVTLTLLWHTALRHSFTSYFIILSDSPWPLGCMSHLTCLVRFNRTMVRFFWKSGFVGRGENTHSNSAADHGPPKKTGLGPVPSEPWFGSLYVWT